MHAIEPNHLLYKQAKETFQHLCNDNPKAMDAFIQYIHAVEGDGALSAKVKQLMTVAISINKQCAFCIAYHTRKALDFGATKEELMETCFTASLMGGGPAMMYTKFVIDEIAQWKADHEKVIKN